MSTDSRAPPARASSPNESDDDVSAPAAEHREDATSANRTTRLLHFKDDLPPCFHGDGRDKDNFSLWKARLELAVKACADAQTQDLAAILPTRLSGDALAYWLSLSPDIQQNYELLVLEAFPNYGECAIAMERFRRFVAGLDPVLQAKCHEHGATSLVEALAIACKWERAQEVLRLAPLPPLSQKTSLTPNLSTTLPSESLSAMVSTKTTASGDISSEIMTAVKQLTADVKALRMEVSQLKRQHASSGQRDYSPERGRDKHRYSPLSSPRRYPLSPASSPHRRDEPYSSIHREGDRRRGYGDRRVSPSSHYQNCHMSSSPHHRNHHISPPPTHRDRHVSLPPSYRDRQTVTPVSLHIMLLNMPAIRLFVVTNVSARPHLTVIVMVVQPLIIKIIAYIRLPIIRIIMLQNGSPTSSLARDLLLTICPHLVII
ncbi:hypothetical protein M9458_006099, partial [Cirrhinus mrigala]